MKRNAVTLIGCTTLVLSGCSKQAPVAQVNADRGQEVQTPCLFSKTTDQVFEYRNMQARSFVRSGKQIVAVSGCLVTTMPKEVSKVSVGFVAFDANGKPISGSDGQQMLTPTQTFRFWSNKSPEWAVPAAIELQIGNVQPKWIEVTVGWSNLAGPRLKEVFLLSTVAKPLAGEVPTERDPLDSPPSESGEERTACTMQEQGPHFAISNLRLRLRQTSKGPSASYVATVKNLNQPSMARAWLTFTAFDRAGHFIGSNGAALGAKGKPPPVESQVANGFGPRTDEFDRVSDRTLLTFQWYATDGCRWSENHFVDAARE